MNKHTNPISIDRQGPIPARATSSITLTAGAMMFPLSIYTAVSDLAVTRSERLNGDPAVEVGRVSIRKDTGAVVNTDDVTRMAQANDGKWVVVTDAELADVYGNTGEAQVVSFVPIADAGRYVTDGIVQVRASKDKRAAAQAANEQAFSLLLSGMRNRQVHALVRFVMRGGPRYGLLTADGDMFTIIPAEAVRAARLLPIVEHDATQLDMMSQFIDAIGVTSELVNDDTPTKVQAFIDSKAAKCGVDVGGTPVVAHGVPSAASADVMAALEASINAAKAARKAPAKKAARPKVVAK
jgi:non-homologous end joining protein Ku